MVEHERHVGGHSPVNRKEISEMETTDAIGVPLGHQEVRRPARLPGVVAGEVEQTLQSCTCRFVHRLSPYSRRV